VKPGGPVPEGERGGLPAGLVDAHCHLTDPRLPGGPEEALAEARRAGVSRLVLASGTPADWEQQAALAARSPAVSPVYGVHPWVAASAASPAACEALLAALRAHLARHPPGTPGHPVGLGELGWDRSRRVDAYRGGAQGGVASAEAADEAQARCLRAQLQLAGALGLPVVLHVVRAHDRVLGVLRDLSAPGRALRGVAHGWSGSAALARAFVSAGLHISFGAAVADPRRRRVREAARVVPLERLLVETDSPDQPPPSHRGEPNRPAWLPEVVAALARVREEPPDVVARATAANARRLFGLDEGSG